MFLISGQTPLTVPGVKIAATPYWYWWLDQQSWEDQNLNTWIPQRNPQQTFFMQIGLQRPDREVFYNELSQQKLLENCLHSYRQRGIFLPNDVDSDTFQGSWQRFVNHDWYQQTWFSLTVETYINDAENKQLSLTIDDNLFFSEKTYKAIACQHPFVLMSTYHSLSYLRSQGFETFPELFDENYDNEPVFDNRIIKICNTIKDFQSNDFYNPIVQEKIRYNHARFFNKSLTHRFFQETVVYPVLDFLYA